MEIFTVKTPIIQKNDNLYEVFVDSLNGRLQNGDIVCVASKVVSMEQGRMVKLSDVIPSEKARQTKKLKYSKDFDRYPELAELVIREADKIFSDGLICLTLKNYIFIPSAGIDVSNAPEGYAILWPENPWQWAKDFRENLRIYYSLQNLGVIVTDSHCTPLRKGVTGIAIAYSGFEGVQDERGKKDLYGKPLIVTQKAVADDLAAAAILMMGESSECMPFVVIRHAPVIFTNRQIDPLESFIAPDEDLFAGIYNDDFKNSVSKI